MENCIFCKIINKESPVSAVYEDKEMIAFMNIRPIHEGECLVIPKEHIDHFTDVPEELAGKMMQVAHRLGNNMRKEFNPERIGYLVHGYGVAHAHLIITPQHHAYDLTSGHFAVIENGEVKFTVAHIPLPPREELDNIAKRIKL